MSYTALYRKKRPRTFSSSELVGQPHIVRALSNQLIAKQTSHAYLFCGTRGTGKTSVAKIFARAVNCLSPQEGSPCNKCEMCTSILSERSMDVVEIDAASNNGVENIRDLREEVKYPPSQGQFKVYIVDEVHMLSTSAFNALLKTLEEPPSYVIFILATTDPQKVPATILSRCQRYDFRRISAKDMVEFLKECLNEEGVAFEENALDYIAYHSDGAMRDALSLLDQCLSLREDTLTYERVLEMLGAVDKSVLFEFTNALVSSDSITIMKIIDKAMNDGRDVNQFAADLVRHFRDVLVASIGDGQDFSSEIATKLKEQGKDIPTQRLMEFIHTFSEMLREMRFSPHARTTFEVAALRICMPQQQTVYVAPQGVQNVPTQQTSQQANKQTNQPTTQVPNQQAKQTSNQVQPPAKKSNTKLEVTPAILEKIKTDWQALCKTLPPAIRTFCSASRININDGVLQLFSDNQSTKDFLKGRVIPIREAIAEYFNLATPPNLAFEVQEAYNKKMSTEQNEPNRVDKVSTPQNKPQVKQVEAISAPASDWATIGVANTEHEQSIPDDWASFGEAVD